MKKKWMFAALVAIFALAMVGCPTDGGDDTTNTGDPNTGDPNTGGPNTGGPNTGGGGPRVVTFYDFEGGTKLGEVTFTDELNETLADEEKDVPATPTRDGYKFNRWESGGAVFTKDTAVYNNMTVVGTWFSKTVTVDNKAKVRAALENGSYVIAKFTLGSVNNFAWADYDGITVDYKLSDAAAHTQIRSARLMGVYVDSDFEQDGNEVYVAKFDDHNAAYIINDKGLSWGTNYAALGYTEADTWFTTTYPIDGTGKNSGYNDDNLPGGTNNDTANVVYFGVGIAGVAFAQNPSWTDRYIEQLIGDVKLKHKTDDTLDITASFDFTGNGDVAFAGYIDPIHYSWASLDLTEAIAMPVYTPPPPPEGTVPATEDFTLDLSSLTSQNLPGDLSGATYQPVLFIPVTFTAPYTVASYAKFSVKTEFYKVTVTPGEDGAEDTYELTLDTGDQNGQYWGYGNCVFVKDVTSLAEYVAVQPGSGDADNPKTLAVQYNLGQQSVDRNIPADVTEAADDFVGFVLTNGGLDEPEEGQNKNSPIVKVLEITFFAATE